MLGELLGSTPSFLPGERHVQTPQPLCLRPQPITSLEELSSRLRGLQVLEEGWPGCWREPTGLPASWPRAIFAHKFLGALQTSCLSAFYTTRPLP